MVTDVPIPPLVGEKPVMVGAASVKFVLLVAVPAGVVTAMGPVVAPAGTVAAICEGLLTLKAALVPLNLTAVAPVKFVPVIVTDAPTGPLVGVKLEMVGADVTVNVVELVAVPPAVVTLIGPVVAPAGTIDVIRVAELTV